MNKKQTRPQQQTEKDARAGLHKNHRQRLRDRYEKTRLDGFADHEALELLLTFAIPRGDVNPTAHRLLERFGSFSQVLDASAQELAKVGEQVGSDVPYCVLGGTALAQGRGEILTPLPPLPPCWIVLCKPPFSISTPALFREWDKKKRKLRPDTKGVLAALEQGDLVGIARRMFNVFEAVLTPHQQREIQAIKTALLQAGALGATMSGSGPTVLGLFDREDLAQEAVRQLKEDFTDVYLTQPV